MKQQWERSVGLHDGGGSDSIFLPPPCGMLGFPPQADRPSLLVYFQQWYQKGFLVKPKRGHSNNTQGQWWEPASLPVIIHLFAELMTGGRELGASSHVMSPTHAKGLGGQAGDKKCGLYQQEKATTYSVPSPSVLWRDSFKSGEKPCVRNNVFIYSCPASEI